MGWERGAGNAASLPEKGTLAPAGASVEEASAAAPAQLVQEQPADGNSEYHSELKEADDAARRHQPPDPQAAKTEKQSDVGQQVGATVKEHPTNLTRGDHDPLRAASDLFQPDQHVPPTGEPHLQNDPRYSDPHCSSHRKFRPFWKSQDARVLGIQTPEGTNLRLGGNERPRAKFVPRMKPPGRPPDPQDRQQNQGGGNYFRPD